MKTIPFLSDFISLLYPRLCYACGNSLFRHEAVLCMHCHAELPRTHFHQYPNNPLEKVFWGRVSIRHATALYFFIKGGKVQHLIHQLKYKGGKEAGIYTGKLLGRELLAVPGYREITRIIPVPLHPRKMKKRGYNQSEQFALGLAEEMKIELDTTSFIRTVATDTQTKKSRFARFENVKEIFKVVHPDRLENGNILLVDDVVTTGSTLESCATILLQVPGTQVSIAAIAYAID